MRPVAKGARWAAEHPHHGKIIYSLVFRDQTGRSYRITFRINMLRIQGVINMLFKLNGNTMNLWNGFMQASMVRVYARPGKREESDDPQDFEEHAAGEERDHGGDARPGRVETP